MAVRAKFLVNSVLHHQDGSRQVNMLPVYPDQENPENKVFWNATPAGQLTMTITNPGAFDQFQPGKTYYLDFTEAG